MFIRPWHLDANNMEQDCYFVIFVQSRLNLSDEKNWTNCDDILFVLLHYELIVSVRVYQFICLLSFVRVKLTIVHDRYNSF